MVHPARRPGSYFRAVANHSGNASGLFDKRMDVNDVHLWYGSQNPEAARFAELSFDEIQGSFEVPRQPVLEPYDDFDDNQLDWDKFHVAGSVSEENQKLHLRMFQDGNPLEAFISTAGKSGGTDLRGFRVNVSRTAEPRVIQDRDTTARMELTNGTDFIRVGWTMRENSFYIDTGGAYDIGDPRKIGIPPDQIPDGPIELRERDGRIEVLHNGVVQLSFDGSIRSGSWFQIEVDGDAEDLGAHLDGLEQYDFIFDDLRFHRDAAPFDARVMARMADTSDDGASKSDHITTRTSLDFEWEAHPDASRYQSRIGKLNDDGSIVYDEWGSPTVDRTASAQLPGAGYYVFSVRTISPANIAGPETSRGFLVTSANNAPVADAGAPLDEFDGADLQLDAGGSFDPDPGDAVVFYEWDLNDNGIIDFVSSDRRLIIDKDQLGDYFDFDRPNLVNLVVRDAFGNADSASTTVTIRRGTPAADFEVTSAIQGPQREIVFDAGGSIHENPNRSIVSYRWDFGDGTAVTDTVPTASHEYASVGTFVVTLTVSDGVQEAERRINLPIVDRNPNFVLDDRKVSPPQESFTLPATDADGETIVYSARVLPVAADVTAFQLDQQFDFRLTGNLWLNHRDLGEKWVQSNSGWHYVTPDGKLFRHNPGAAGTLAGTLDTSYYGSPSTLIDVKVPLGSDAAGVSIAGNQITVVPEVGVRGRALLEVTGRDLLNTVTRTATLSLQNHDPQLVVGDKKVPHSQELTIDDLPETDADGETIVYSAQFLPPDLVFALAYQLDQQLDFRLTGNPYLNYLGLNEKWVQSNSGWHYILPNGDLFRHVPGSALGTFAGMLDGRYHTNPGKLVDVPNPADMVFPALYDPANPVAYQLDRQLDFRATGEFYENYLGLGEKWLQTNRGWHYITPIGDVFRHNPNAAGTPVGVLDGRYHADPLKLIDVPAVTLDPNGATITIDGNWIIVDPKEGTSGALPVRITASDGRNVITKDIIVHVLDRPPQFEVGPQTIPQSQQLTIEDLPDTDADGDTIIYSAQFLSPDPVIAAAYQFDQELDFRLTGNLYLNFLRLGEKWLQTNAGWHYITPSGEVVRHNPGAVGTSIGVLDRSYHANPSKLVDAPDPAGPMVTAPYRLDQELNFRLTGNLFLDYFGLGERWLQTNAGWHYITPDGNLCRHVPGTSPSTHVGTVHASYHADPSQLVDVPISTQAPGSSSATVNGNQIIVDPDDAIEGILSLQITASDGRHSTTRVVPIHIVQAAPLMFAGEPGPGATAISHDDAVRLQSAAIAFWLDAGVSEARAEELRTVSIEVVDLSGQLLALAGANTIRIDAAGHGWFIDVTTQHAIGVHDTVVPNGQVDMLTVMAHELGHHLGLQDDHDDDEVDSIMDAWLMTGERRLPHYDDFKLADPDSIFGDLDVLEEALQLT